MNNSCANTDGQSPNFLKLTNKIRVGVCVRETDTRDIGRDLVITVNNFGSCSIWAFDMELCVTFDWKCVEADSYPCHQGDRGSLDPITGIKSTSRLSYVQ